MLLGALFLGIVGAVLWGRDGVGPLASMLGPPTTVDGFESAGELEPLEPPTTTSTIYTLTRRSYRVGDCILWDQSEGRGNRSTKVVGCDEPHLLEFIAEEAAPDGVAYPADAEWRAIIDRKCGPLAVAYLGQPIDPSGRFFANALRPTEDSWRDGDRELACGIAFRDWSSLSAGGSASYVGRAKGQDQTMLLEVGACIIRGETGGSAPPVSCAEPHLFEIAGHADVGDRRTELPTEEELSGIARPACERLAAAYTGGPLPDTLHVRWFPITAESWAAGRRSFECALGRYESGAPQLVTGSLAAAPKG
jgi:hypothetical protein